MQVEVLPIADFTADPENARVHDERNLKAIARSLEAFGQQKPIVVDRDGIIVAGNGTVAAASSLGWTEIAVVRTGLDKDEARAYAIADNRTAELATWDAERLALTMGELDVDLAGAVGFSEEELGAMLEPFNASEAVEEEPTPEPPADPITKPGDLWLLGEHRVLCGDSTDAEAVERVIGGEEVDCVFTDPPYGMRLDTDYSKMPRGGNSYAPVAGDHEDFDPSCIFEVEANAHFVWGADWFYPRMPEGFSPIVWDKQPFEVVAGPQNHFELCWVRPKRKRVTIRHLWTGFTAKERGESRVHPTQKPVAVCVELLGMVEGGSVFDPFLGSGTTLIAAEQLGRKCYGMELEPAYCDVIVQRWENLTGQKAQRAASE